MQEASSRSRIDALAAAVAQDFESTRRVLSFEEWFDLMCQAPQVHARNAAQYLRDCFDYYGRRDVRIPSGKVARFRLFDCAFDDHGPGPNNARLVGQERAQNAFVSPIRDRSLFRNATFILEVAARRPTTEIQAQFPHLFKLGPSTKMNEIVNTHLPGVPLVHMPTPPPQIRTISDHVYFRLDKGSPLWPEFSTAASIGMHFSGEWPDLELDLWAVLEDRR